MSPFRFRHYDVAIVGAGPAGCLCALAHAREGARVILLEANPESAKRMAGEWLHPPALRILRDLGVRLDDETRSTVGKGFVVWPENGSEEIVLPYSDGTTGLSCHHIMIVTALREAVERESAINFISSAKVVEVEDGQATVVHNGQRHTVSASRIVGADGRGSIVRRSLGLQTSRLASSRMVGVKLRGVTLPRKGYGYVFNGGPGPVLMYHIGDDWVRVIIDVPHAHWAPWDRSSFAGGYAALIPKEVRPAFIEAVQNKQYDIAANEMRARLSYGNSHRVLIGDAAGHYHPLTAAGMTIGFGDALALSKCDSFKKFTSARFDATRATDMLAMGLYEIFADQRVETDAIRTSIYQGWRVSRGHRERTMRMLACQTTSQFRLGMDFSAIILRAFISTLPRSLNRHDWRSSAEIYRSVAVRLTWFLRGLTQQHAARRMGGEYNDNIRRIMARALPTSMSSDQGVTVSMRKPKAAVSEPEAVSALQGATGRLLSLQRNLDGAWEGEMVWCPMLTAQYVLAHYIVGHSMSPERRRLVLRHFERTRLEDGTWGMHEHSQPHLFVTTLVYVAARVLGVEPGDPLIKRGHRFIETEGVAGIPTWGKFWLALMNLYDWSGVNAIVPEVWLLPKWMPLHPSKWYCHTRLIYMAMATIYSQRHQVRLTPLIENIREELYPHGYDNMNFARSRNQLRDEDLFARPNRILRAGFVVARAVDRLHSSKRREHCVDSLEARIRWELRSSDHTSISPVSGLLNIIALRLRDPRDQDANKALERLEGWIWEDEQDGARVTGARSASWDTGIAMQALQTVSGLEGVEKAMSDAASFLVDNQIAVSFENYREAYRADPKGGWCFAGGWHGWPVSDCTAEAVLGLLAAKGGDADRQVVADAVQFILRSQNRDGGFGSYEARRTRVGLEWMNPAEMFGESMTEHSFVECTASCVAALADCKKYFPELIDADARAAMKRAEDWLRNMQQSDGSWRGVWGVQYIYGTYFGIRGLIAAGVRSSDPALRLAGKWLVQQQRPDGGWGEHQSGCLPGKYVEHDHSQVIQTSWALIALLLTSESNWSSISRGIRYLVDAQQEDGSWPKQEMAGVFFRTALLDYVLYRQYFPLHAIGLYLERLRSWRKEAESRAIEEKKVANCA